MKVKAKKLLTSFVAAATAFMCAVIAVPKIEVSAADGDPAPYGSWTESSGTFTFAMREWTEADGKVLDDDGEEVNAGGGTLDTLEIPLADLGIEDLSAVTSVSAKITASGYALGAVGVNDISSDTWEQKDFETADGFGTVCSVNVSGTDSEAFEIQFWWVTFGTTVTVSDIKVVADGEIYLYGSGGTGAEAPAPYGHWTESDGAFTFAMREWTEADGTVIDEDGEVANAGGASLDTFTIRFADLGIEDLSTVTSVSVKVNADNYALGAVGLNSIGNDTWEQQFFETAAGFPTTCTVSVSGTDTKAFQLQFWWVNFGTTVTVSDITVVAGGKTYVYETPVKPAPVDPAPEEPSLPTETIPDDGEVIVEPAVIGAGAPEVKAENAEEVKEAVGLTPEEKAAVEAGAEVKITLSVEKADTTAAPEEKAAIEEAAPENFEIGIFLDIKMDKQVGTLAKKAVSNLMKKIDITVAVPAVLINTDDTVNREYVIIHCHNGITEVIPGSFDPVTKEITFPTDKFSTYAIAYRDTPKAAEEEPSAPVVPVYSVTVDGSAAVTGSRTAGSEITVSVPFGMTARVYSGNTLIATLWNSGTFTMPAGNVKIIVTDESGAGIMASTAPSSYIFSYDSSMKLIKTTRSKNGISGTGEITVNLGADYAGKSVTLYSGKKSVSEKLEEAVLDSKGSATFTVKGAKNYTLVVED